MAGVGAIGQIARSVRDIRASETWFRDVLQLPHLYTFGTLAFFDCGGTRLFLEQNAADADRGSIMYFRVTDIHRTTSDMKTRGIEFIDAPHVIHKHDDGTEEWMAFFKDNEDRTLAIMEQVRAG